ncbi:MAG: hypothetical protein ACRDS9_03750 [Pseudonocardiaceae bacterium]
MRISAIFAQASSYDYGDCGGSCNSDFRGRDDPNYFTGLEESRNNNYRTYDDETDSILGIL